MHLLTDYFIYNFVLHVFRIVLQFFFVDNAWNQDKARDILDEFHVRM
jgi:hypothetical protein